MRDRIWKYLTEVGNPVSAAQVLQSVLGILSLNQAAAEKLLKGIVGSDPRIHSSNGLWRAEPDGVDETCESLDTAATVFLEKSERTASFTVRGAVYIPSLQALCSFLMSPEWSAGDRLALERVRACCEDRTLVAWTSREIGLWKQCLKYGGLPEWYGNSLVLRKLAAAVGHVAALPEQLARALGLPTPDSQSPEAMACYLSDVLKSLLELVPAEHRGSPGALERWIQEKEPSVDFSRFGFGPELLADMPESPGVYLMKSRGGDVIYVGKSRNLKRRVRSYFTRRFLADAKIKRIHEHLHTIDFFPTSSEVEALLMETRLIQEYRPTINLQAEIHERPDTYGKGLNLLVLVPNADSTKAQVYFLRTGVFAGRQSVPLGRPPSKRLCARVHALYFTAGARFRRHRSPWEAEIVARWFSANRRRINFIDIDDAGTFENAIQRVDDYLSDPERLSRKVLYR